MACAPWGEETGDGRQETGALAEAGADGGAVAGGVLAKGFGPGAVAVAVVGFAVFKSEPCLDVVARRVEVGGVGCMGGQVTG